MIALALLIAQMPIDSATSDEAWVPCERRPLPRAPCVDLRMFFLGRYWPPEARSREHGRVTFWVRVDRYGNVTDCRIMRSSGYASFDARTCLILRRRVVYHPARDANNRAVDGIHTGTVRWENDRVPQVPPSEPR